MYCVNPEYYSHPSDGCTGDDFPDNSKIDSRRISIGANPGTAVAPNGEPGLIDRVPGHCASKPLFLSASKRLRIAAPH
jgi:hypothetical protein